MESPNQRAHAKVLFEFFVPKPNPFFYRGVQVTDGSYRMEKRGSNAKNYRAFMWCDSEESLYLHRHAVQFWTSLLLPSAPRGSASDSSR